MSETDLSGEQDATERMAQIDEQLQDGLESATDNERAHDFRGDERTIGLDDEESISDALGALRDDSDSECENE